MFIPLNDKNPLRIIPFEYVNVGLIAANVLIFVVLQSGLVLSLGDDVIAFGVIPAVVFDFADLPPEYVQIPEDLTLVTYMFLHGGWLHLASNMLFLWVFGDNVEDSMGHFSYLLFYLLCGAAAGFVHAFMQPMSESPLIGASGAVSGVVAAYLLLHPRVKIWILVLWRIPLRLPAFLVLGAWIAMQVGNLLLSGPDDDVAWWAHLGGLAAGAILIPLFKRRDVPLFDRGVPH